MNAQHNMSWSTSRFVSIYGHVTYSFPNPLKHMCLYGCLCAVRLSVGVALSLLGEILRRFCWQIVLDFCRSLDLCEVKKNEKEKEWASVNEIQKPQQKPKRRVSWVSPSGFCVCAWNCSSPLGPAGGCPLPAACCSFCLWDISKTAYNYKKDQKTD